MVAVAPKAARTSAIAGGVVAHARVVIDHGIDTRQNNVPEVRRLHVHHGNGVVPADRFGGDVFDLDIEQLHHGDVFGPRHLAKGANSGGLAVASEKGAQGHGAGDGIGVRVVLDENQQVVRLAQGFPQVLHILVLTGVLQFELGILAEEASDRDVLDAGG